MPEGAGNRELVERLLKPIADGKDFVTLLDSPDLRETVEELVAPDAPILFVEPTGGFVGDMAGPWTGPEGFMAGWGEWLASFESFRFMTDEIIDCEDGRVLLLTTCYATLRGSTAVIEQKAAAVYSVAVGRFDRMELYLDQLQARAAAGLA